MDFDEDNVYGSGLNRADWYLLKDAILCAAYSPVASEHFDRLPQHLQDHEVGRIIANCLAGNPGGDLNAAAKLMVPGADGAWLALEKS